MSLLKNKSQTANIPAPIMIFSTLALLLQVTGPSIVAGSTDKYCFFSAKPTLCGAWCEQADALTSRCTIDPSLVPCSGDGCVTTCRLWVALALGDSADKVPCEIFVQGAAYHRAAEPCDPKCLLPEVRAGRYAAPTGLGFFCAPGTCKPIVQAHYENNSHALGQGLRILQCPCNWFGTDCKEGREPVLSVEKGNSNDGLQVLRLHVGMEAWQRLVAGHRAGGVVRLAHYDKAGLLQEQPYALLLGEGGGDPLASGEAGYLELLSGPPESADRIHHSVVEVARRLRAMPPGRTVVGDTQLFIYPTIGGFFNRQYSWLLDAMEGVEYVMVLATGSGLAGALSAAASLAPKLATGRLRGLHVIYGLKELTDLPANFRSRFIDLVHSGSQGRRPDLTLLASRGPPAASELTEFAVKGEELRRRFQDSNVPAPFYVQHAAGFMLSDPARPKNQPGASWRNTAIVSCGRVELLDSVPAIWQDMICANSDGVNECLSLQDKRLFTNI